MPWEESTHNNPGGQKGREPPVRQRVDRKLSRPFRPRGFVISSTQGIGLRPQPWARVSRPVGPDAAGRPRRALFFRTLRNFQWSLRRERDYLAAALPFLLLEVLEDPYQVIVETSSMLLANLSHFFDDRVLPHEISLPSTLQQCRLLGVRILPHGIYLRRFSASVRWRCACSSRSAGSPYRERRRSQCVRHLLRHAPESCLVVEVGLRAGAQTRRSRAEGSLSRNPASSEPSLGHLLTPLGRPPGR